MFGVCVFNDGTLFFFISFFFLGFFYSKLFFLLSLSVFLRSSIFVPFFCCFVRFIVAGMEMGNFFCFFLFFFYGGVATPASVGNDSGERSPDQTAPIDRTNPQKKTKKTYKKTR